jgi:hypothetical protein
MHLTSDNKFKKLVVIGDRVLIPGPGYAIPMPVEDEPWKQYRHFPPERGNRGALRGRKILHRPPKRDPDAGTGRGHIIFESPIFVGRIKGPGYF